MGLPESYTVKTSAIPTYFEAVLNAQPPERFSLKFLENLGFTSTNDRLLIAILKDLGFLNADGAPQQRYYEYLDRTRSKHVLAEGIKEAYSDLFAVNVKANELTSEEVKNKLRTLYAGKKSDLTITRIAKTFEMLCQIADFSKPGEKIAVIGQRKESKSAPPSTAPLVPQQEKVAPTISTGDTTGIQLGSLQYHINIVLPESRDQAVYDAIFKSLKEHLR